MGKGGLERKTAEKKRGWKDEERRRKEDRETENDLIKINSFRFIHNLAASIAW